MTVLSLAIGEAAYRNSLGGDEERISFCEAWECYTQVSHGEWAGAWYAGRGSFSGQMLLHPLQPPPRLSIAPTAVYSDFH
ncbi:hypothetical protein QG37_00524 [Candidozyma auris]|nr:hypothetical protein QG37_00524 [[Candida] auris]